jgi:hypothetical protein
VRWVSIEAMSWVIKHSQHGGSNLLVLLLLADHAGNDDWTCWPSVALLARECRMSDRTVQRVLRQLEASGEIASKRGAGVNGTTLYRVLGVQSLQGVTNRRGDTHGAGGDIQRQKGVTPMSPKPSENHQENHHRKERPKDPIWDGFVAWLRRSPETQSERGKWNKAAKELRDIGVDDPASVVARGRRYEQKFPGIVPTPNGLVAHWGECNGQVAEVTHTTVDPNWATRYLEQLDADG